MTKFSTMACVAVLGVALSGTGQTVNSENNVSLAAAKLAQDGVNTLQAYLDDPMLSRYEVRQIGQVQQDIARLRFAVTEKDIEDGRVALNHDFLVLHTLDDYLQWHEVL